MQKTELFNTHSFVKSLVKAGMEEKQAEVLAEHQLSMLETQIATKADMVDLTTKLAKVETKLEIAEKLQLGILLGIVGLIIKALFV